MAKRHNPRRGSMQFWPRNRAKRIYPRIKSWPVVDGSKLSGFAGYKAGMTQIRMRDNSNSTTKGQIITVPVTILECPPLKPLSLRFYKNTEDGLQVISEIHSQSLEKELSRKINVAKKQKDGKFPKEFDQVSLQVYTQPKLTTLKKTPEIFEVNLGKEKSEEVLKPLLEKEIKISEIFKEGQFIDTHSVTTGRGFQGPVKRFGVKLRAAKSEKVKRGPGSLGPWKQQQHTMYRIAHAGQTGFQTRVAYNKLVLKISSDPKEINPKEGINGYGLLKSDYVLIKGSIPGPKKRLIRLIEPIRVKKEGITPEIIQ